MRKNECDAKALAKIEALGKKEEADLFINLAGATVGLAAFFLLILTLPSIL